MSRGARTNRTIASDLLADGWLSPHAAAKAMGITHAELLAKARRGEVKRRELAPHTGIYLYEVHR